MDVLLERRLPVGAEPVKDGGAHFRVWAPRRARVDVMIGGTAHPLTSESDGYFSGLVESARPGTRYRFRLDGGDAFPDPASRYQPDGPHGDSVVIDPSTFAWTDRDWAGCDKRGQIFYELHVGTFTPEGTYRAAAKELPRLADLGVTVIEVMPLAEFPGAFGWGYDGVDLFAPFHGYGEPDDLRAFVDRAHALGVSVILDVVYNHFGPDGNYLAQFSDTYFSQRTTDWGPAINYDGPGSGPVREMMLANARHWIEEYHFDGLRLDATDNINDESSPHLLAELARTAREAAGRRSVIVIAEYEAQKAKHLRAPDAPGGGHGLDMVWNDDFHHAALVAATGRREAYLTDYRGSPQELISAIKRGYLYQGQRYSWQRQRRGTPALDMAPHRFIHFLENHDQVANSVDGKRLRQLTSPGVFRALTALLLLAPEPPMLFQGQEYGATTPFLFFADHHTELAALVRAGRRDFLGQFPSTRDDTIAAGLADPADRRTFERSRLDPTERDAHPEIAALHRDLLSLRVSDPVLSDPDVAVDGAVLAERAFVIRFFSRSAGDRLLAVNLGEDLTPDIVPEPLLAPPRDAGWERLWHSEELAYGGRGMAPVESPNGTWHITAASAALLG